jgi:hypothetical protein
MQVLPEGLVQGSESYEHLGQVATCTMDMHARYEAYLQARRAVIDEADAYVTFSVDLPASPPVVWSWMNDPAKRQQVAMDPHGLKFVPILRPGGRTAAGATTHCVHGASIAMRETVLDWKPFEYYTLEQASGPMGTVQVTYRFEASGDGRHTLLAAALRGSFGRLPGFLNRWLIKIVYGRIFASVGSKLAALLAQAEAAGE